jgi:hypothetical protein
MFAEESYIYIYMRARARACAKETPSRNRKGKKEWCGKCYDGARPNPTISPTLSVACWIEQNSHLAISGPDLTVKMPSISSFTDTEHFSIKKEIMHNSQEAIINKFADQVPCWQQHHIHAAAAIIRIHSWFHLPSTTRVHLDHANCQSHTHTHTHGFSIYSAISS